MKRPFFFGLYVVFGLILYGCTTTGDEASDVMSYIPEEADQVLRINNLSALFAEIQQNDALSVFQDLPEYQLLSGAHPILHKMAPGVGGVLCLSQRNDSIRDYVFISRKDSLPILPDSLPNLISETLQYGNITLDRIQIDEETAFLGERDSVLMLSSSQQLLEELLKRSPKKNNDLNVVGANEFVHSKRYPKLQPNDSLSVLLADEITLDITVSSHSIVASGITKGDSINGLINVFKGQIPRPFELVSVIPTKAQKAMLFTTSNTDELLRNLARHRGDSLDTPPPEFVETISEIGWTAMPSGNAVLLKSIDGSLTNDALRPMLSEDETYKDVALYEFSRPKLFNKYLSPLITTQTSVAFRIDQFFCFAENKATAESLISAFKTNNVLKNSSYFQNTLSSLASSTSLMILEMDQHIASGLGRVLFTDANASSSYPSVKSYPLSALQFSYDRDFAHVNFACKETVTSKKVTGSVSQIFGTKLKAPILGIPGFFSNHRTGGKDIAVQDINNVLYLISSTGKILWDQKLDGPIVGEVHEVDLLRNRKKQLAFTTSKGLHILDRNGKPVAPFPVKFRDAVTQPLAVFDYDKNRKYRFAVVQGDEILLYDSKAKVVKGFTFKKASSNIALPAQHIRMGNKDYVLIAEENGTLNILSRVGKQRVKTTRRFEFSEMPIASERNNFVVITKDKTKVSIGQSGKLDSQKLNVSDSYSFVLKHKTKATLDDNLLRIDGLLVELPFGIYTSPRIFRVNRETYITVTELQEKKIFVFDKAGNTVQGFPVYGTSEGELAGGNKRGALDVVVKGDEDEVILYRLE